ncbi:MAG: helix-turn-helix transcriptional regulator [Bacteroidota bacterium]
MEGLQPRLSEIIKDEREEKDMTFPDFAKLCNVSERTMKSAEYGDIISTKSAKKILEVLGYEITFFVTIKKVENLNKNQGKNYC